MVQRQAEASHFSPVRLKAPPVVRYRLPVVHPLAPTVVHWALVLGPAITGMVVHCQLSLGPRPTATELVEVLLSTQVTVAWLVAM
jgi:hypothetical protein